VCVEILSHLRDAMAADSRVLIVEQVLTNPPAAFVAVNDVYMMTLGGKERTLEGFRQIATRAGLEVVRAHDTTGSDVAVVECRRA
jgi:hypothetical protein